MSYRENAGSFLTKEQLTAYESILYEPVREELLIRDMVTLNTDATPGDEWHKFNAYAIQGKAKRGASGAEDYPLVDGQVSGNVQKIVKIYEGFSLTKQEVKASQKQAGSGGPRAQIDTIKPAEARRLIMESEQDLFFNGDTDLGVSGLFTKTGIKNITVATGPDSGGVTWADKTAPEILADLLYLFKQAQTAQGAAKAFMPDTIAVSSDAYYELKRPYSNLQPGYSVLDWILSQGGLGIAPNRVFYTTALDAANSPGGDAVNKVVIFDSSPRVVQMSIAGDIEMNEPVYRMSGGYGIGCDEYTAGCILRQPRAVAVGKGI